MAPPSRHATVEDMPTRAEIAVETVRICEEGSYLAPSGRRIALQPALAAAVRSTALLAELELEPAALAGAGATRIEVTAETTAAAARRLAPAMLLNFASATRPGGGFLNGAKAQEEDLALASGLYPCLLTQPEYYRANLANESALYTDRMIHAHAVPFFRDDSFALLEEPFFASVLTAPAPNAGVARERGIPELAIRTTLARRARRVLAAAAAQGHRRLVLGAWGCGVFQNDPAFVADCFAESLAAFDFEHVCFAVADRSPGRRTLAAFALRYPPAAAEPRFG